MNAPIKSLALEHHAMCDRIYSTVQPLKAIRDAIDNGSTAGVPALLEAAASNLERAAQIARAAARNVDHVARYRGGKTRL